MQIFHYRGEFWILQVCLQPMYHSLPIDTPVQIFHEVHECIDLLITLLECSNHLCR